jgi:regulator of replication initiation timing
METHIVPKANTPEILDGTYEPESEEALIAYAANIHNRVQTHFISAYWEIGRTINAFYKGKYGTNELERIAQATGIGRDTLNKMLKFSKQYSREQVQVLLSGRYPMTWFHISQNLSVAPDKIIEVYKEANDPKEFHNNIMNFKDAQESRGKSRKSSVLAPLVVSESSVTSGVEDQIVNETPEQVAAVNVIQATDDDLKELNALRVENKKLRADLEHREYQVNQMEELFHESALENRSKDELIERLKRTIDQVHNMVENGYDHVNILSQIDWRAE